ncbi:outer membrane protein assembly factor BamE domain-containing protein [Magnetococcales bacterium HHB-1]
MQHIDRHFFAIFSSLILLVLLAGCQARIHEKGNIIRLVDVEKILPEITSREGVKQILGNPTLVNNLDEIRERWIYIQDRRYKDKQYTYGHVVNRVEITFDSTGTVIELNKNFDSALLDPKISPEVKKKVSFHQWLFGKQHEKPLHSKQKYSQSKEEEEGFWQRFGGVFTGPFTQTEKSETEAVSVMSPEPDTTPQDPDWWKGVFERNPDLPVKTEP